MRFIYTTMKMYQLAIIFLLVLSFATPAKANPTPIPDYDFDKNFNNLTQSNLTVSNLTHVGAAPYEDLMGSLFWGLLFTVIFGMLFITIEDITIPALLGLLIGASLWYLMPGDWSKAEMSLMVVSFAGLVYSLVKRG